MHAHMFVHNICVGVSTDICTDVKMCRGKSIDIGIVCRPANRYVYMCVGMCTGMCAGMCVGLCAGMCTGLCTGMCTGLCAGMGTGMCTGMYTGMCTPALVQVCL